MELGETFIEKFYAVPLVKLNKFAHVSIIPNPVFGTQILITDKLESKPLKNIAEFEGKIKYLPYRFCQNGEPRTRKYKDKIIWYAIGEVESKSGKISSDYKSNGWKKERHKEWTKFDGWLLMKNFEIKNKIQIQDYTEIENIPLWVHSNYIGTTIRIEMLWMKMLRLPIDEHYKKEIKDSTPIRMYYYENINNSIFTNFE